MTFSSKTKSYVGSGYILDWVVGGKPIKFVMTCAHNFADDYTSNGRLVTLPFKNITCYQLYDSNGDYAEKYKVTKTFIHPCWNGTPGCGFDFAVGILSAPMGGRNREMPQVYDDYFVATLSEEVQEKFIGMEGLVVGYPGDWNGTMAYHDGPFT